MSFMLLDKVLWAMGFVCHGTLLFILSRRSAWREFPVLTTLIMYQVMESIILFVVSDCGTSTEYYWSYWLLVVGDCCFQIALIIEIARIVFRSVCHSVGYLRRPFAILSLLGTAGAAGICLTIAPFALKGPDLWEMRVDLFTSMLTCGLFVCMSMAANRLRLVWRSHVMAIGLGLTAWAVCAVIGDVSYVLTGARHVLEGADRIRMYVYLAALVFWMIAFWTPEGDEVPTSLEIRSYLLALSQRLDYHS